MISYRKELSRVFVDVVDSELATANGGVASNGEVFRHVGFAVLFVEEGLLQERALRHA